MADKYDYKKEYNDLYLPKSEPAFIEVPQIQFIMADGSGNPNGNPQYEAAMSVLYALTFTIKMSRLSGNAPVGYFDYVVPPLEGLWWTDGGAFRFDSRDNWRWTSMIRQPDFVTDEVFLWAVSEVRRKKPSLPVDIARLESFREGLCAQMMHHGPYADEPASIERMRVFIEQNGFRDATGNVRRHHEIYLSDPRKTAPEKLRTVLRHPVEALDQ